MLGSTEYLDAPVSCRPLVPFPKNTDGRKRLENSFSRSRASRLILIVETLFVDSDAGIAPMALRTKQRTDGVKSRT